MLFIEVNPSNYFLMASRKRLTGHRISYFMANVNHPPIMFNMPVIYRLLLGTLEAKLQSLIELCPYSRHLQSTQSTMDTRLHDGGLFMQKLSELTMAKPEAAVQVGPAVKVSGGPMYFRIWGFHVNPCWCPSFHGRSGVCSVLWKLGSFQLIHQSLMDLLASSCPHL